LIYGTYTGTSGDVFSLSEKIHLIYGTYTGTSGDVFSLSEKNTFDLRYLYRYFW